MKPAYHSFVFTLDKLGSLYVGGAKNGGWRLKVSAIDTLGNTVRRHLYYRTRAIARHAIKTYKTLDHTNLTNELWHTRAD